MISESLFKNGEPDIGRSKLMLGEVLGDKIPVPVTSSLLKLVKE